MISPKVSFFANIVVAVLAVIVAGGAKLFPSYVPDAWASGIVQTCAFLVALATGINSALHGYSSAAAGPLTGPTLPPLPPQKMAALILLGLLFLPLAARDARAEPHTAGDLSGLFGPSSPIKLPKIPLPIPLPTVTQTGDVAADLVNINKQIVSQISTQLAQIANIFVGDAVSAAAEAIGTPGLIDGNGNACWTAAQTFTAVLKAHPAPLTGQAMSDLESARLLTAGARKLCDNAACQQVFSELVTGVQAAASAAPIGGAALISQNPFTTICAHVPTISMVAMPAGAPTPVPSP